MDSDDAGALAEIRSELARNEYLLWAGRPRQGIVLRRSDVYFIPISFLLLGFMIFGAYSIQSEIEGDAPFSFDLFDAVLIAMSLYFVVGRFFLDAFLRRGTAYGLTDRRAIIVTNSLWRMVRSVELATLVECSLLEQPDRDGTIVLGAPPFAAARLLARTPWFGVPRATEFDLIPEARRVFEQLRAALARLHPASSVGDRGWNVAPLGTGDGTAEAEIRRELAHDERLIWSGQPRRGVVFRESDFPFIPFSLVWLGFSIFWVVLASILGAPIFFPLFGALFVAIGLYLTVGRFVFDAYLRRRTSYGLTNRRAIIVTDLRAREVRAFELATLGEVAFFERSDGRGTIVLARPPAGGRGKQGGPLGLEPPGPIGFELIPAARQVFAHLRDAQTALQYPRNARG